MGVLPKRWMLGIPAIRKPGMDVYRANWRGILTGQGETAARQALIVEAVRAATMHESWQETRPQNRWKTSRLFGYGCNSFIDFDLNQRHRTLKKHHRAALAD